MHNDSGVSHLIVGWSPNDNGSTKEQQAQIDLRRRKTNLTWKKQASHIQQIITSRQHHQLSSRSVLFHHAVRIGNLVQSESLRHRDLQRACFDLLREFLQRSLHGLFGSA